MKKSILHTMVYLLLICLSLLLAGVIILPSPVYAITNEQNIRIIGVDDLTGDCGQTIDTGPGIVDEGVIVHALINVTGSINDSGGANNDYFNAVVRDATGNPLSWGNKLIAVGTTNDVRFFMNLLQSPVPDAHPWSISFYDPNRIDTSLAAIVGARFLGSLTFDVRDYISCDESGESNDEDNDNNDTDNIVYPPDDRVNWQFGDDVAVIFKANDAEGNPALHIYQPDSATPDTPIVITQDDFLDPMPPAVDTWIAGEGLVNVYVLATGEIQVNMGPTPDGKVRVVIFADLTGQGSYGYEYNVFNETASIGSTNPNMLQTETMSDPAQDFMCNFVGTC